MLTVLATILGLTTSLGLSAQQAASGLDYFFGWDSAGNSLEITIIVVVTALATISVARGLDGGVKLLSNVNMLVALALLLFVFFVGNLIGLLSKISLARSMPPLYQRIFWSVARPYCYCSALWRRIGLKNHPSRLSKYRLTFYLGINSYWH